jgi:phosphotransferase system HPr (HPr) family protein
MVQKDAIVRNKIGLHARPAALFVQLANKFSSDIFIKKEAKQINGKSIMGIMALGIAKNDTITIIADGPDEEEAIDVLSEFIEKDSVQL